MPEKEMSNKLSPSLYAMYSYAPYICSHSKNFLYISYKTTFFSNKYPEVIAGPILMKFTPII
jgi:putative heme iron utilization protein